MHVPEVSEKTPIIDINPRMGDVYDLIDSITSIDFCRESLSGMVQKFNNLVETVKLKNMQIEARDNMGMKLQAELWEHEAARCEMADEISALKKDNRALRTYVKQLDKTVAEPPPMFADVRGVSLGAQVTGGDPLSHLDANEFARMENINRAQSDQLNALSMQLEAQQHELQQLRLSQVESQEKRVRLCDEIARLNRMIAEMSGRLQGEDRITKIAIA